MVLYAIQLQTKHNIISYLSDFLKVQLRKGMEPVGDLTNIEELHLKSVQGKIKTHMKTKQWSSFSLKIAYSNNVGDMQLIKGSIAGHLLLPLLAQVTSDKFLAGPSANRGSS